MFVVLIIVLAACSAPQQETSVDLPAAANTAVEQTGEVVLPSGETQVSVKPDEAVVESQGGDPQAEDTAPAGETQAAEGSPNIPDDNRLPPEDWRDWPVVPEISGTALEIYRKGLDMGNDPRTFTKVGDCQAISEVLLGIYDTDRYSLKEDDAYLQETIDHFAGSFNRDGMAVKGGFNAAAVLSPIWADPDHCLPGETPLECEIRVHNPSMAIISLEVWWEGRTVDRYEEYMRMIIEYSIEKGVLPILSTKADNVEGDHSINAATARLAYEYDIPLWNFWLAVQSIPHQGIDPGRDGFHITTEAWTVRSFTALQVLDAVWRAGSGRGEPAAVVEATPSLQPSATLTPEITLSPLTTMTPDPLLDEGDGLLAAGISGKIIFGVLQREGEKTVPGGGFLYQIEEGQLIQIAQAGYNLQAVSPNGRYVLMNKGSELFLSLLDGSAPILLTDQFYYYGKQGAAWLADGQSIGLIANRDGGEAVWVIEANGENGSEWKRVMSGDGQPIEIYASHDPDRIYWEEGDCSQDGECQRNGAWAARLDGTEQEALESIGRPEFSNDGSTIAYSAAAAGGSDSLIVKSLDGQMERTFELPGDHLIDYSWSPDGEGVSVLRLIRSDYSGRSSIVRVFLVTPLDWGIREFEPFEGLNTQVTWSPDGSHILLSGTEPAGEDGYRLHFDIYDVEWKVITAVDNQMGLVSPAYISVSNIYWIGAQ